MFDAVLLEMQTDAVAQRILQVAGLYVKHFVECAWDMESGTGTVADILA